MILKCILVGIICKEKRIMISSGIIAAGIAYIDPKKD